MKTITIYDNGQQVMAIDEDSLIFEDMIHIIYDGTDVQIIQCFESGDKPIKVKDCLDKVGYTKGTVIVIAENPLEGTVIRYGNHGQYWEKIGSTRGYA